MTREEREAAIAYIKTYRKLDEDLHNNAPNDSVSYYATDKCLKYWDMAIQALSQEPCDDAISREDAIKAQCEACDICGNMRYTKCQYFMQGCNEVKCLRELPPVTQKSGKWIPVSERLPEVGISILVSDADSDIYFTHITRDGVFFDEWGNKIKGIAWMPLPKPYETRESEE